MQTDYLTGESIGTIYFGGGTPSVLSTGEAKGILQTLFRDFIIEPSAEITIEVNPDDLSPDILLSLRETGFNRLSIGIQSFSDSDLQKMNRRHTSLQALNAVYNAEKAGFKEVSIDLMFGFPGITSRQWAENLKIATSLPVNHISAYHLAYHEGTPFNTWLQKGILTEVPEEESVEQFEMLIRKTGEAGFEQYEISNFARNNAVSRHNCNYWLGAHYLGLGPSAHSYNGISRKWNKPDLDLYISSVQSGKPAFEDEVLTEKERLNDYLITRIRTKWGISLETVASGYGEKISRQLLHSAGPFLENGCLVQKDDIIRLTPKGIMISDHIMLELIRE